MPRRNRPAPIAASAVAAAVLVLGGCDGGQGPAANTVTPSPTTSLGTASGGFPAQQGPFVVNYRLDARTVASMQVSLDPRPGTLVRWSVKAGDRIAAGAVVGRATLDPGLDGIGPHSGTVDRSRRQAGLDARGSLTAPLNGTATRVGDSLRVSSSGLDVVASLTPLQVLRYRGLPFTGLASVETILGQRTVKCQALWIEAQTDAQTSDGASGGETLHCRLPADVESAPGLPGSLALASRQMTDVVAVPAIYVGVDSAGENYVVHVRSGASTAVRPVVVGPTDGVRRVILEGVRAGELLAPVSGS